MNSLRKLVTLALAALLPCLVLNADDKTPEDTPAGAVEHSVFRPVMPANPATAFAVDKKKPKPVKVSIYPMYAKLPRGGKCPVVVELKIEKDWHINANPPKPDFLIPTKLELKTDQKIKLTKVRYPKSHPFRMPGSPDPYYVYDGTVAILGLLEIDAAESADSAAFEFHLNYQGCNNDQCHPPDKIVMQVKPGKMKFADATDTQPVINAAKFEQFKPKTAKKQSAAGTRTP